MIIKFASFFVLVRLASSQQASPCNTTVAAASFATKTWLNPFPPLNNDPYSNQTDTSMQIINETIYNTEIVCGLQYNDSTNNFFHTKQFPSQSDCNKANYTVTHQGKCGVCTNTVDLAVYLTKNLTEPVRMCGVVSMFSDKKAYECIVNLGFSENCAAIWYYNTLYTKKNCFLVCLISWLKHEPFNKPDGSLNDCLQCDEDKSGPIFKYFAGRTRRDSGIVSEIQRPGDQVYNMTQCYY